MAERINIGKDLNSEIVALREMVERHHAKVRAEALEEAAQFCERLKPFAKGKGQPGFTEAFQDLIDTLAAGIRGLSR